VNWSAAELSDVVDNLAGIEATATTSADSDGILNRALLVVGIALRIFSPDALARDVTWVLQSDVRALRAELVVLLHQVVSSDQARFPHLIALTRT